MHKTNYESRTPECSKNRGEKKVPTKKQAILTLLLVSLHTQYAIANTETIRHTITLGFKEVTVTTQTNSQISEFYEHHTNVNNGPFGPTPWRLSPTLQGPESSGAFSSISSTKCTKIETKLTRYVGTFYNISEAGNIAGSVSMDSVINTNYAWEARTSLVTWTTHRGRVEIPARTTLATEKWRCPIGERVNANTPQLKLYFSQSGWPLGSEGTPVRNINLTTQLSERNTDSLTLNLWAPTFTDSNSKLRLLTGYSGSAKNQYELKLKTNTDGESLLTLTDSSGRKINWQQVISSDSVYVQTAHRPGKIVIPVTLTITSK